MHIHSHTVHIAAKASLFDSLQVAHSPFAKGGLFLPVKKNFNKVMVSLVVFKIMSAKIFSQVRSHLILLLLKKLKLFWPCPWYMEFSGPETEPTPQH